MKILAVLLSPPVPATAGHRVRNRSLLRALALEGHEVTVIAFASPQEIAEPSREFRGLCHEYHLLPAPEGSSLRRLLAVLGPAIRRRATHRACHAETGWRATGEDRLRRDSLR